MAGDESGTHTLPPAVLFWAGASAGPLLVAYLPFATPIVVLAVFVLGLVIASRVVPSESLRGEVDRKQGFAVIAALAAANALTDPSFDDEPTIFAAKLALATGLTVVVYIAFKPRSKAQSQVGAGTDQS